MSDYVPSTEAIRDCWGISVHSDKRPVRLAEFDRWLNRIKAEAWDEGYMHCFDMERRGDDSVSKLDNPYRKEQEYDGL